MTGHDTGLGSVIDRRIHEHDTGRRHGDHERRLEIARGLKAALRGHLRHGCSGHPTLDALTVHHRALVDTLHAEIRDGATRHRRVPAAVRLLPVLVTGIDGVLLYSFCADIFNARFAEASAPGFAALGLAVLGSAITYAGLTTTGTRLRDFRGLGGEIRWRLTDWATRFLVGLTCVLVLALAVLMFERVSGQAAEAVGVYVEPDQVLVLGLLFAVLSACANLVVVAVHALDGSSLGAEARSVGRAVRSAERRFGRMRRRALRRALRTEPCPDPLEDGVPLGPEPPS